MSADDQAAVELTAAPSPFAKPIPEEYAVPQDPMDLLQCDSCQ